MPYDPLELARRTEQIVLRGEDKLYYRFRGGQWYGGIATADCCGCPLRCIFCWGAEPRDNPKGYGRFYSPEQVFQNLTHIARKRGYSLIRISGNEPTLGREHLTKILEMVEKTRYTFILETSGILLDRDYVSQLSQFKNLHVRVSLKGACEEEFSRLTGAKPEGFQLQLKALENLVEHGVSCNAALMSSFSTKENITQLIVRLHQISDKLSSELEDEIVILYPRVQKRLQEAGIQPFTFCNP
ncbi:MAG: radical SAM protein [Candidatus Freyarchaeota archaeon]|nr:radical SAM protein [Candidatus Jordarchaeia archaeon]MBS7269896.1 radical SAM protein [Candidatus Jordarchaeia archaeon]MBS7279196.1 radical SAM protein [Candidatus Jordarchaeia archaeon]